MSKIITTDQEWRTEDLLDALCRTYQKPKYDPWGLLQPTKTFIKEIIKQLKTQCYAYTEEQDDFARLCNAERHEKALKLIGAYDWRLKASKSNPEDSNSRRQITSQDVVSAKQTSIRDYYQGNLRKTGKDLVGLCPFHQDRHASFTIYSDGTRYKCFSCGAEGDVIDFVMKTQNKTFIEAVKLLCKFS